MAMKQPEPFMVDIKEEPEPFTIESLCVHCGENGETVLMMSKIPFFKEMLIGSFSCGSCGERNNEVQFCGELPSHGVNISFKMEKPEDLNREIIKSEHAILKFQELDLEIPESKKAEINTIEGILMRVEEELKNSQESRKELNDGSYEKVEGFITRLQSARQGENLPMKLKIMDPSGNSNIKNPLAPKLDHKILISYVPRTLEQSEKMGYSLDNSKMQKEEMEKKMEEGSEFKVVDMSKPIEEDSENFMKREASIFEIDCHACMMPGQMKMCQTSIPHFSDLIIMSFLCQYCGAHETDTKNSSEASDNCTILHLKASSEADLRRQLFKSETCKVEIPEIELQLDYGTLGGNYTTVEGLLDKIKKHIGEMNSFTDSDSYFWWKIKQLMQAMDAMISGERPFNLILTDPLSKSFLQNPYHPEDDPSLSLTIRARSEEEDDFLGFTDMKV